MEGEHDVASWERIRHMSSLSHDGFVYTRKKVNADGSIRYRCKRYRAACGDGDGEGEGDDGD